MIFPKTKKEITQAIINTLPRGPYHSIPIDNVIFDWWLTGRGGQGLRLSDPGLKAFENARIEFYDFPLGLNSDGKRKIIAPESFVHELIKKIRCPYYLGIRTTKAWDIDKQQRDPFIRIYDHKTAMMITLHGNLRDYLDAV